MRYSWIRESGRIDLKQDLNYLEDVTALRFLMKYLATPSQVPNKGIINVLKPAEIWNHERTFWTGGCSWARIIGSHAEFLNSTFVVHVGILPFDPRRSIVWPEQPFAHRPDGITDNNLNVTLLRIAKEWAVLKIKQNTDPWLGGSMELHR